MSFRLRGIKAGIAGLAALGALLPGAAAQAEGLKIGALMPMTGGLQAYGESSLNGIRLAVEEANEAGGVLGGAVEVVVGDTQTRAQPAVDAARRLINVEGVGGIIGALSSGNSAPVATSVTGVLGVPQISSASTAPSLSEIDANGFFFRTVPSDAFQGVALAQVVREQGLGRVASIFVNNDYGQGLNDSFKEAFEALGGTVTGDLPFEANQASYRGELQRLASGDAEALLLIAYPDDGGILILRQSLEEGLFDRFVFTDGMKAERVVEQIGAQFLDGAFGTAPRSEESDASRRFRKAYEKSFGELPPRPFIDTAYDATMIMLLAAEKAGSRDGTAIRDAIREIASPPGEVVLPGDFAKAKQLIAEGRDINYEGAAGPHDFDENGDVTGSFEHWKIENGALVTVRVFFPE
jgi:branched-chain amino acid transport system substrate-binding protein